MRYVVVGEWIRYVGLCRLLDTLSRGEWMDALRRGGWMDALS